MSRLLLDTTVLIDLEWAGDDLGSILLDEDDVAISAVTVVELEVGIRLASDGHRGIGAPLSSRSSTACRCCHTTSTLRTGTQCCLHTPGGSGAHAVVTI